MVKKFDIEDIIDKIIDTNMDPSIFSDFDDSDTRYASNIFEWCMDPEFLNLKPYPRQLQMMLELFEDVCLDCSSDMWRDMHRQSLVEIQDETTFLEFGVCPKCSKTRGDYFKEGKYTYPWEIDACVGQRFGKSAMVTMINSYVIHRFLKISSPYHHFGLQPTTLHMTLTAIGYDQAKETLLDPLMEMIDNSPWFIKYHKLLDHHNTNSNKELYSIKGTFMHYAHRGLLIYAKGPDKRKMRGRTRFGYSADEIGWMHGEGSQVTTNPDEINKALSNSMTTIRQAAFNKRTNLDDFDCPMAIACLVSSPSHANDKIMRLVREGHDDPRKVVFHYATWEAHPVITRASLESDFRTSESEAERDFGANPPIANSPFMDNHEAIEKIFTLQALNSLIRVEYIKGNDINGKPCIYPKVITHVSDKQNNYIMAIDAGHTNNSFGITLSRLVDGNVQHDILVECQPTDGHYVNFNKIFKHTMAVLFKHFNVKMLVADRWQGLKMLHDAGEEYGVEFEQYSLDHTDLCDYREAIYDERVKAPKLEEKMEALLKSKETFNKLVQGKPALHLALQYMTVKEVGRRIEKGDGGGTDDLFRAGALAHTFLVDEDYLIKFGGNVATKPNAHRVERCVIRTKSGNSSTLGRGSNTQTTSGRAVGSIRTRNG